MNEMIRLKGQMVKRLINLFVSLSLILLAYDPAYCSSGASFLKLGVGARAIGMGSSYTAIANDVTALHWNPAGLAHMTKKEMSVMHAELFADTRFDFFAYAHPTSKGTVGIGAIYLSQGSLEGRTESRTKSSDFSANDLAVTLGASRFVIPNASLGMNLKLVQSKISGYSSTGFAFDVGMIKSPNKLGNYKFPLTWGLAIQNLGPHMKFLDEGYNLPLTLAGGIGRRFFKNFLISADLKYQPHERTTTFSIGAEFSPVSMLSLRAGYLANAVKSANSKSNGFSDRVSNLDGLGFGMGIKIGSSAIDYSFTPAGELSNTQRISLTIRF